MNRRPSSGCIISLLSFFLLVSLPVLAGRIPRQGELTPRRGPYAGKVCRYGGIGWWSQVAEFTVPELLDFISGKKPPGSGDVVGLLVALKEQKWLFGSQLSREGFERYPELMRACLEDGKFSEDKGTCRHRAPYPIGIDIHTGKAVTEYMAGNSLDGVWLIRPGWIL